MSPSSKLKKNTTAPFSKQLFSRASKDNGQFFRCLLDQSGDEIMILNAKGTIVYANARTVKALGYSRKHILGRPITKFFKEKMSLKDWRENVFAKIKESRDPVRLAVERVVKGSKSQIIDVTAVFFEFEGQELILSIARNITKSAQLQEELKQSVEMYRLLSEQAAEAIFIVSPSGIIQYANKAGEDLLGVSLKKTKGRHFKQYVAAEDVNKAWQSFYLVTKGSSIVRDEINIKNAKNGSIPVEFTASPVFKEGKIFCIHTIARNISRKRQMEKLIADAEKMKALQNFISGTMQEIYHPLKAVMEHTHDMLNKYYGKDFEYIGFKEYKEILSTIKSMRDQIKYCVETSGRLININKKKAGLIRKFTNINAAFRDIISKFDAAHRASDIKIVSRLAHNLPLAAIAPLEFQQIAENVLTNAIQAITFKGKILVRTWYDSAQEHVTLQVEDEGVGIAKENLSHVFEPFFTTKSRGLEKSSGLGLSIVYSIVKTHHGAINIQSSQRNGTVVTVSLPVYKREKR